MGLPSVTVQTGAVGPGTFPEIEGIALFIGKVTSGDDALNPIGKATDLEALFGAEEEMTKAIAAARGNGGPNWKAWAYGIKDVQQTLDAAPAVDKTGGKTGIPVTAHGIPVGESITLAGTIAYDGSYVVDVDTTTDEIVIVQVFAAEAFTGAETVDWNKDWETVIDAALAGSEPEMIVPTKPVTTATELTAMNTKAVALENLARRVFFCASYALDPATVTWAAYLAAAQAITTGLDLQRVLISPLLWGPEQGAFSGRLAAGPVSRSPARVKSGSVVNPGTSPVDNAGNPITLATLDALNTARFSVFHWYEGKEGVYFADGNSLEAVGGDFKWVEWLRVTDKAARRVRIVAINAIADDEVEDTPAGNAAFGTRLGSPLRAMAAAREIKPLAKDAIAVVWQTVTAVQVFFTIRPLNAPKDITVGITLDTS